MAPWTLFGFTLGHLATSEIVHLVNQHGIINCLGFGVDVTVESVTPQEACRHCFGQSLNITHPRPKATVRTLRAVA